MQSSLIEVKSASDIMLLRIENHSKKKLYKKCMKLIDDAKYRKAIELIVVQDYTSDSTLCVLLSKCICPSFPNITLDGEEMLFDGEIPIDLQQLLDETNDRSDENLDYIIESYYENKDELEEKAETALRLIELAANLGDEIARSQLLTYYARNVEYLEDSQYIFLFIDMLEKAEDGAFELIDGAINVFKRNGMYESAYFYRLIKKAHNKSDEDEYQHHSIHQMLTTLQRMEVERDVLAYLKNRMILNEYCYLA
jgi:glycosyltransferase involved in cell wall biosynthesis